MSITYATALERVQELFRTDGKKASTVRTYLSDVKRFVRAVGLELSDPIDPEFVRDHEAFVAAVLAEHPPEFRVTNSFRRSLRAFREKLETLRWHDDLPGTLAEVLRTFLEREGLTQAEFAQRAGLPLGSIEDYVSGRSTPRGDRARIRKLERAMGLPEGRLEDCVPVQSCRNPHDLPARLFPEHYQGASSSAREARTHIRKRIRDDHPDYADLNPDELRRLIADVAAQDDARQAKGRASKALPRPPELRRYHLLERDWPPHLLEEWRNVVTHKTDPAHENPWSESSVEQRRELLEGFFGWCVLRKAPEGDAWRNLRWPGVNPESLSGVRAQRQQREALAKLGLSAPLARDDVTLALLSVPDLVEAYVDFRVRAAGGYNDTVISFLAMCRMLLKGRTGYVRQTDELADELPADLAPQPTKKDKRRAKRKSRPVREMVWRKHCKRARKQLGRRLKVAKRKQVKCRDPHKLLGGLVDLEDPLSALDEMHALCRRDLKVSRGRDYDVLFTRYLVSMLLAETFLRRSHLAKLDVGSGQTVRVRIVDGVISLHIPVRDFKNRNSRQFEVEGLDGVVRFPDLSPELQHALRIYLYEIRPRCLRGKSHDTLLVVPTTGAPVSDEWIYTAIVKLTRQYLGEDGDGLRIPGLKHLSPHLYRHLLGLTAGRLATEKDATTLLQDRAAMARVYSADSVSSQWALAKRRLDEKRREAWSGRGSS